MKQTISKWFEILLNKHFPNTYRVSSKNIWIGDSKKVGTFTFEDVFISDDRIVELLDRLDLIKSFEEKGWKISHCIEDEIV